MIVKLRSALGFDGPDIQTDIQMTCILVIFFNFCLLAGLAPSLLGFLFGGLVGYCAGAWAGYQAIPLWSRLAVALTMLPTAFLVFSNRMSLGWWSGLIGALLIAAIYPLGAHWGMERVEGEDDDGFHHP
jgi:hypothetical protein